MAYAANTSEIKLLKLGTSTSYATPTNLAQVSGNVYQILDSARSFWDERETVTITVNSTTVSSVDYLRGKLHLQEHQQVHQQQTHFIFLIQQR